MEISNNDCWAHYQDDPWSSRTNETWNANRLCESFGGFGFRFFFFLGDNGKNTNFMHFMHGGWFTIFWVYDLSCINFEWTESSEKFVCNFVRIDVINEFQSISWRILIKTVHLIFHSHTLGLSNWAHQNNKTKLRCHNNEK